MKPLIIVLSPREIRKFKSAIDTINHIDKFWIRNHIKTEALPLAQKTFLENKQYTHFIPLPDDLVVPKSKINRLIEDYLTHIKDIQNTVVCGFCNVDTMALQYHAAISFTRVSTERKGRQYNFETLRKIRQQRKVSNFIKVGWAGLPLMIIPRYIMERVTLRNDSPTGKDETGCCYDVMFCHDAQELGFNILCDTRVELNHLKYTNEAITTLHLKHKKKETYWEYAITDELNSPPLPSLTILENS